MEFVQLVIQKLRVTFKGKPPAEMFITPEVLGHTAHHGIETIVTIDGHKYKVTGYDNLNRALMVKKLLTIMDVNNGD